MIYHREVLDINLIITEVLGEKQVTTNRYSWDIEFLPVGTYVTERKPAPIGGAIMWGPFDLAAFVVPGFIATRKKEIRQGWEATAKRMREHGLHNPL